MAKNGNDWRSGSPRKGRAAAGNRPAPSAESQPPSGKPKERSDWRKKKVGQEAAGHDTATKGKDYLRRRDQSQREKKARHRVKVALWTGLALVLTVVLIVALLLMPQRVNMVRIVVTDYDAPLPPNSYALEDSNLFNEMEASNSGNIVIKSDMDVVRPRGEFLSQLRKTLLQVKPGGPAKNAYIIYLSAHGVVNEKNEPCLMLPGAKSLDSSTWLPVNDMFKQIGEVEKLNDPKIVKVIILDSGRVDELWDAGILYNGFADALQRTVEASELKNLYVLHSCSPGERNWSGPELNGSAFGHYVARGLNGAADLNQDKTVALNELYIYVRARTNQWADLNRGSRQNPRLIPDIDLETKIPLAYRNSSIKDLPQAVDARPADNSKKLNDLWVQHERLQTDFQPYRFDPVGWAEVQEGLVRLESLLLAGSAYNDEFQSLASRLGNKMNVLEATPPLTEIGPVNLPLSEQLHGFTPSPNAVRELQARLANEAAGIPPDLEAGPPPQPKSHLEACYAAWHWLRDPEAGELTKARMDAARNLIDGAPRLLSPAEPIESHFMLMLRESIDWADQPAQSEAALGGIVRQAIGARYAAEVAASPPDERTIYWINSKVDAADHQRRLGEDRLFIGSKADTQIANESFVTVGQDSTEGLYGEAVADARTLAAAFAERDRAWADMRYLIAWALYRMHSGADKASDQPLDKVEFQDLITSLLTRAHELGVALDDGLPIARIDAIRGQVEAAREAIMDDHREHVKDLTHVLSVDQLTKPRILRVLSLPLFTGQHRDTMRDKLLAKLKQSEETIEKPKEILKVFNSLPAWKPTDNDEVITLASMAEHPTLTMVDPVQLDMPDAVNWKLPRNVAQLDDAEAGSDRARQTAIASLAEQGHELRNQIISAMRRSDGAGNLDRLYEITRRRLADEFQRSPTEARRGVSTADRLCRALGPLAPDILADSINGRGRNNPTLALRKTDRYFQSLWLADRALNDFWGPARRGDRNYFEVVTADLLTSAGELLPEAAFRRYNEQPLAQKLTNYKQLSQELLRLNGNPIGVSEGSQESTLRVDIRRKQNLPDGVAAVYLTTHGGHVYRIRTSDATKRRFGFPVIGDQQSESLTHFVMHTDDDVNLGQQFSVVLKTFFRGHTPQAEIPVNGETTQDNTIVTYYEPIYQPEVLVKGDILQKPSVLFVFDCSASMSKTVALEKDRRRMDIARERLNSILGKDPVTQKYRLPDSSFRIGFMMYGHRAGWEAGGYNKIRLHDATIDAGIEKRSLHPSIDVETVIPISRLDERVREDIVKRLAIAKPWGQTPLYYSIKKAMEQFVIDDAPVDAPRQIIVLTDGGDDPGALSNNQSISANDITRLTNDPRYKSIRIDVVAFDFKVNAELTSVAKASGGDIHEVTQGSSLERVLNDLLSPISYHVQPASDNERKPEVAIPLGERWVANKWSHAEVERAPRMAEYRVDLFGVDLQPGNADNLKLLGGESLIMNYNLSPTANRLEHLEYKPPGFRVGGSKITEPSPTGNDRNRRFKVTSWIPKRFGNVLQFDVSVQHAEYWPFTPRPERMWVEIRPLDVPTRPGVKPPVYNFFDNSIVQGKPVPVYRYTVQNWPKESLRAEVRVWFLTQPLKPAFTKALTVNNADQPLSSDGLRQQLPHSTFQAKTIAAAKGEPFRVYITETIGSQGSLYGSCVDIWPRPDKVVHNYQGDKATHEFVFNNPVNMPDPTLSIWSRSLIEQNSVQIDGNDSNPMRYDVPKEGN